MGSPDEDAGPVGATASHVRPALRPGPVSYVRAVLVSGGAGLLLGVVGAWLVTVAWFAVHGGDTLLDNFVLGALSGVLYALLFGPLAGVLVAVPTGLVVAWVRRRRHGLHVVRATAAAVAGVGMLLFVVFVVGDSVKYSTFGGPEQERSLGWVVPVTSVVWSAGWAYALSVWRPPVVVQDAPADSVGDR